MDEFIFSPDSCAMEQTPLPREEEASSVSATAVSAESATVTAPDAENNTPATAEKAPKPPRNGVWMTIAIIAICFSLALGGIAIWAAKSGAIDYNAPVADIPQSVTPSYNYRTEVDPGDTLTDQEIIKKLTPSVVTIAVTISSQGQTGIGCGTGVIYTDNGYIITNAHVVEQGVSFTVADYEGKEYSAKLIGADASTDVAVLKIDATGLIPAEFGQSSKLVPGDRVIAIGTPYSPNLSYTATAGIVSKMRDQLKFSNGDVFDLIQHDAAINSGNSGGPLINVYGQVIGINNIKVSVSGKYENLSFALQIDKVLPIAEELMQNGKVSRPGIGITGATYDADGVRGVYIHSTVAEGPAALAGLKQGDIIIKAGDKDISSMEDLKAAINSMKIGDTMHVTYRRGNTVHTADLVLAELSAN